MSMKKEVDVDLDFACFPLWCGGIGEGGGLWLSDWTKQDL